MRIDQALAWGARRLGGELGEARLLLVAAAAISPATLHAWPEQTLELAALARYRELVNRRRQGEPVAYLTGERGFWSLSLAVDRSTLIPRPESELLVEWGVELMASSPLSVALDLGTGSGAIGLALATERPDWLVVGVDRSWPALAVAAANRHHNRIDNLQLLAADWLTAIKPGCCSLIVANPPYIAPEDPHLLQGDLRHEPRSALVAAADGLADLYRIIDMAAWALQPGGWLLLEHGWNQADAVQQRLRLACYQNVASRRDLAGHWRATGGSVMGDR